MKKYLIKNALNYFKENRKIYVLFMIEILIALTMMNVIMNISYSSNLYFERFEKNIKDEGVCIVSGFGEVPKVDGDRLIDSKDYYFLKEKYGEKVDVSIAFTTNMTFIKGNEIRNIKFLIASEEHLKYIIGYLPEKYKDGHTVIVGPKAKEVLNDFEDYKYASNGIAGEKAFNNVKIDEEIISFKVNSQEKVYDYIINNDKKNIIKVNPGDKNDIKITDLESTVIIPMDYAETYIGIDDSNMGDLRIHFIDGIFREDITNDLIVDMQNRHDPAFTYMKHSDFEYLNIVKVSYENLNKSVNAIAAACLIIIIIGINGIVLISIQKRKRNFAISLTMGAKTKDIIFELLVEIGFVVILPTIVSTILSIGIINFGVDLKEFDMVLSWKVFIFTGLLGMLVAAVSALIPMNKVKKLLPIEILRNS